jgi:hypothetical protein
MKNKIAKTLLVVTLISVSLARASSDDSASWWSDGSINGNYNINFCNQDEENAARVSCKAFSIIDQSSLNSWNDCVLKSIGACTISSDAEASAKKRVISNARGICVKQQQDFPDYNCTVHEDTYESAGAGPATYFNKYKRYGRIVISRVLISRSLKSGK